MQYLVNNNHGGSKMANLKADAWDKLMASNRPTESDNLQDAWQWLQDERAKLDRGKAETCEAQSAHYVRQALSALAFAAVWAAESRKFTEAPTGAEQQLWFMYRTLAHEFIGGDVTRLVANAKHHAEQHAKCDALS